jgi:hypothetical protein
MKKTWELPVIPAVSKDGFYFVLLGAAIFITLGWVLSHGGKMPMHDFRTAYYCGKALVNYVDPYSELEIERLYSHEAPPTDIPDPDRIVVTKNPYLPSTFPFTFLLALLPEHIGILFWTAGIAVSFLLASFLIWRTSPSQAAIPIGILAGYCLASSASLFYFANPAGFVVPLCILGCLSFISGTFIPLGIPAFAISLAFKPHDGALIFLYFLLAGGTYRKRALQTLLLLAVLTVPALVWLNSYFPQWSHELSSNMAAFSGPGHVNDPRAPHGTLMMINLQTVTSFFWAQPRIYDSVSYLICGLIVLLWIWITLRTQVTLTNTWLALASISALCLLPVYHRQYDAKLIMLQLPALGQLWTRRHRSRWIALAVTALAIFLAGDLPWLVLLKVGAYLRNLGSPLPTVAADILLNFTMPLALLSTGVYYLWLYIQQTSADRVESRPKSAP